MHPNRYGVQAVVLATVLATTLTTVLPTALAAGSVQAAEAVLVNGATQGQGTLRARSGECFAITPQHVVGHGGVGLTVTNAERVRAPAQHLGDYGDDIALLRVDARGRMTCGATWPRSEPLDELLEEAVRLGRQGTLLRVRPTGGIESHAVRFTALEPRHVEVVLITHNSEAFQGISGSRLLLEGRPVGMVLKTIQDTIRVYRQDALNRRLEAFFAGGIGPIPAGDLPLEPRQGRVVVTTRTTVRESPTPFARAVRRLEIGQSIELLGKVKGRPWWQTAEGYVRVAHTAPP